MGNNLGHVLVTSGPGFGVSDSILRSAWNSLGIPSLTGSTAVISDSVPAVIHVWLSAPRDGSLSWDDWRESPRDWTPQGSMSADKRWWFWSLEADVDCAQGKGSPHGGCRNRFKKKMERQLQGVQSANKGQYWKNLPEWINTQYLLSS